MSSREQSEPWDHGLSEIARNPDSVDNINVQFVEENWKNEAFMSFCFFNARVVSMTPKEGINKLKEDERGFWKIVHPVDIAWAVTKRVDNEERWKEKYEKDKGQRNRSSPRKSRKRSNAESNAKSNADAEKDPVKAVWTMTEKPKYGEDGWNMAGRNFLTKCVKL